MSLLEALYSSAPSLLWPMDHASGAPVDASGNGRNATTFGTVTPRYAQAAPGLPGARTAYGAATISNGYGLAAASDISWAAGTNLSAAFWAVLNATPANPAMVFGRRKNNPGGSATSMFYMATNRTLTFYMLTGGANENYAGLQTSSGVNFVWGLGAIHMVAVTFDSSNLMKFYLDGLPIGFDWWPTGSTDSGYTLSATATQRNNFGDYFMAGGGGFDTFGTADMTYGPAASWNRTVSASEMKAFYDESLRGGVVLGHGNYGS